MTVVTGTVYHAPKPERTVRNGVTIIRVGSTAFDRRRLSLLGLQLPQLRRVLSRPA